MIEALKTIQKAPMGTNFTDVLKSASWLVASLVVFTVKLTLAIIASIFTGVKHFCTKITK